MTSRHARYIKKANGTATLSTTKQGLTRLARQLILGRRVCPQCQAFCEWSIRADFWGIAICLPTYSPVSYAETLIAPKLMFRLMSVS